MEDIPLLSRSKCQMCSAGLHTLELGSNRIRSMTGVETLVNLQELWLGRNRIPEITGLDGCVDFARVFFARMYIDHDFFRLVLVFKCRMNRLQKLSVQSNRLTRMVGLNSCTNLREVYLSHNGIETIEVGAAGSESFATCWCTQHCISSNRRLSLASGVGAFAKPPNFGFV